MQLQNLRQLASRSALLLTLGLTVGACDAVQVEPFNSISSDTGFTTKEDAAAGLNGVYDGVQSGDYMGIAYPSIADLITQDVLHRGTFTTTYGVIGINQALADNIQVGNTWTSIYNGINRANYLLQESEKITDPAFPKLATQAQARAIRAYNYMNLVGLWGGTPEGYGFPNGLGVPLRLTPTTAIGAETQALARSSEAEIATVIRTDLDFAITNLPAGNGGARIARNAALALRARFELRMRDYTAALNFARQVPVVANYAASTIGASTTTGDAIWQLNFTLTDQNSYAFFWAPAPGGRDEFNPGTRLAAAHAATDRRLPINIAPGGTTLKYNRTATRDDPFNVVRYAEVVLTIAEAAAQTGDLTTALTQTNIIRARAGLVPVVIGVAPTPAPSPAVAAYITPTAADPTGKDGLITEIIRQRRLEFAYEGIYWFDLRRTNRVQSTLGAAVGAAQNAYNQSFRNLFPIPLREVQLTNNLIVQNPGY